MDVLLQGPRFKPAQALEKGLVDELVGSREDLLVAAKAWIEAHAEDDGRRGAAVGPQGLQDARRHAVLARRSPQFLPAFPAMLRKQTKGALYPAPRAIMAAAVEGAQVDFETASTIESRYLTNLIVGQNSKNMIQAFFFDLSAINGGSLRPEGVERFTAHQGARPRRRHDGCRHRLLLRPQRHRGRAQGRLGRGGREGQVLLGEAAHQGGRARQDGRGEEGRDPRPDPSRPPTRRTRTAATW